ncbi:MAG: MaoC/PaaZ C-terminal domain-containing protein [Pseudomonadota bacterium]|nr:MaoC/PaaZ C-terminal domain-containing protein [Pseudomonadota bacterium]
MNIRHFDQLPKPYVAYGKVIASMLKKSSKNSQVLPEAEYVLDRLQIDQQHLHRYKDVCGFKHDGLVPATYLVVLGQSLQLSMMTDEAFPFPIIGLVHIRNSVTQYRPIQSNEALRLSCRFDELQPHEKGVQFDFVMTAKVGDELVWEGATTYLMRQKVAASAEKKPAERAEKTIPQAGDQQAVWSVPENIGRRYGMASGDFNLIHVHAVTAKAFGFPKAIAHGLWSKARCLAEMGDLPAAYRADVQFKLPVLLPAKVEFLAQKQRKKTEFSLSDAKSGKPHLAGTVTAL